LFAFDCKGCVNFRDLEEWLQFISGQTVLAGRRIPRGGKLDFMESPADIGSPGTIINLRNGPDPESKRFDANCQVFQRGEPPAHLPFDVTEEMEADYILYSIEQCVADDLPAMMRALPVALFFSLSVVALKASADAPLKSGNESNVVTAIEIAQKSNVRESCGPEADESFTDADYQEFTARKMPRKIAQSLRSDRKFMEGVLALREKPAAERGAFIQSCRRALRPTWAELGRISCEGQTDAGQAAELDIANAVADMIEELVKLPKEKWTRFFGNVDRLTPRLRPGGASFVL